jgi:GT2 family glycosyltransferase
VSPFSQLETRLAAARPTTAVVRGTSVFFGRDVARIAERIEGGVTILACEPASANDALLEAITLRRAGLHFWISVHVEDARARRVRERAALLCRTYATWDEVRLVLDGEREAVAELRTTFGEAERSALLEAIRLADGLIVRSWAEHRRLIEAVGRFARDVEIVVNDDRTIVATHGLARTDIVVYAPRYRADELAPFVTALGDLEVPVTIVARDLPTIPTRLRFDPPEGAADALGRARAIIDANGNDPGVTLALARLGRPLGVASDSGGLEVLRRAGTYDLWSRRTILATAVNALSADAATIAAGRCEVMPQPRARPAVNAGSPLVSVIVPTYNRERFLAQSLATIERQTYPNLEIIVVNDGGSDVREIVAASPRARLIDESENRGPAAARNRGLAEAQGDLIIFFDDDDEMFPDHVAVLADALERSGLDVAYGQMLNVLDKAPGRPNDPMFAGHSAIFDHADIRWAGGGLAPTAILFRRAILESVGTLDASLISAEDYEFWIRLARGREWARVSAVTSMYFVHQDGSNYSARDGVARQLLAHRAIYAAHPSTRPLVQAGRRAMIEYFGGSVR